MALENNYLNKSTTSPLRACRGCLATDARLYDMRQSRLLEAYSNLLSTTVQVTVDLPHYLCSYCAALLLKCDTFRTKCIDTLKVLTNAHQSFRGHLKLTTEYIKAIDRPTYFTKSLFESLTIEDDNTNPKQIYSDTDTDIYTICDIFSDSGDSIDSDDFDYVDECLVSDKEEKSEHDYVEYHSDDEIECLLKKYSDNERSGLLKDFKVNIDCEASETIGNIRAHQMHQLSEIINHIQYSSETSNELMNTLDKDILKCENDGSKCVNNTIEKCKVLIQESESNIKANTINEQGVSQLGEKHEQQDIVKGNINKSVLESRFNILPVIIKNVNSNAEIRHSLQNEHIKTDVPKDKPFFETFEFEDDIEIKAIDFKLDDSNDEIPHSLQNEHINIDVPQDNSLIETQYDEINETNEFEDDIETKEPDSDEEIPHSLQNEHIKVDVPQDNSLIETQYDEMNETNEFEDDIETKVTDFKLDSKPLDCKNKSTKAKKVAPNNIKQTKRIKHTNEYLAKYNIEVRYLSKEEQKKEMNDRKDSDKFKYRKGSREKLFQCNICFKGFIVEESYKNHMLLHDDISGEFVCDICQCRFMTKFRLTNHHQLIHFKLYTCKDCGHTMTTGIAAVRHYNKHNGRKYPCKYCGKEFKNIASRYKHNTTFHKTCTLGELVRCEICGGLYNGLVGLNMHCNRAHTERLSPECRCSTCDTQFHCSDAFKAHQGTDGLCDTLHKYCVRCGMSFETEELLKEHEIEQQKPQNKVAQTRERPFKCQICRKAFQSAHTLKQHNLVHTGERPYTCDTCGKTFQTKSIVNMHIRLVHMKIPRKRKTKSKI